MDKNYIYNKVLIVVHWASNYCLPSTQCYMLKFVAMETSKDYKCYVNVVEADLWSGGVSYYLQHFKIKKTQISKFAAF
jgi:hypothetical protein